MNSLLQHCERAPGPHNNSHDCTHMHEMSKQIPNNMAR